MQVGSLTLRRVLADYIELTKPRIVILVLLTTLVGIRLASGGVPPAELVLFTLIGTGLAAASAATLNNFLDRSLDAKMPRTCERALPAGRLKPKEALSFGITLGASSLVILGVLVNIWSALLALVALLSYVLIYTAWLKRTTPLCTVVGGVTGALPPVIGWTAASGKLEPAALVLFAIIFLWQPPHFWALALLRAKEYEEAGIPVLPVVHGPEAAHRSIALYAAALVPVSLMLYPLGVVGLGYLLAASALGLGFVALAVRALLASDGERPLHTRRLFLYSISYLGMISLAMLSDCLC